MNKICPDCLLKIKDEDIYENGDAYCEHCRKRFFSSEILSEDEALKAHENNRDNSTYLPYESILEKIYSDIHFIKTVVLVFIILSIIGLFLFTSNK